MAVGLTEHEFYQSITNPKLRRIWSMDPKERTGVERLIKESLVRQRRERNVQAELLVFGHQVWAT